MERRDVETENIAGGETEIYILAKKYNLEIIVGTCLRLNMSERVTVCQCKGGDDGREIYCLDIRRFQHACFLLDKAMIMKNRRESCWKDLHLIHRCVFVFSLPMMRVVHDVVTMILLRRCCQDDVVTTMLL